MRTRTIRALRAFTYSLDGINANAALPGDQVTVRAGAADALVQEGYAEEVAPIESSTTAEPTEMGAATAGSGEDATDGDVHQREQAQPAGSRRARGRAT